MELLAVALGIGALLLAVVLVVVLFGSRQRTLSIRVGSFTCLVRPDPPQDATWSAGTAQYGVDQLMWWRTLSLSPRPDRCWSRGRLVLLGREPLDEKDDTGRPMLLVHCRHGQEAFELKMSGSAFAGLISWLEAAPRGRRVV